MKVPLPTIIVTTPDPGADSDLFEDCTAMVTEGGVLEIHQSPREARDPVGVDYVVRKRYSPIGWLEQGYI